MKTLAEIKEEVASYDHKKAQVQELLDASLAEAKDVDGHKMLGRKMACLTAAQDALKWALGADA